MTSASSRDALGKGAGSVDVLLAATAGFACTGLLIGGLTLELNTHLQPHTGDALLLLLYFGFGYGVLGFALGAVAGGVTWLLRRLPLPPRLLSLATPVLATVMLLAPFAYYLLLPDVGVGGDLLTEAIFDSSRAGKLVFLASLGLVLVGMALVLHLLTRWLSTRLALGARRLTTAVLGLLVAGIFFSALTSRASVESHVDAVPPEITPAFEPTPLVVLCIDGADFGVIRPMIEDGELPTFARLLAESTWGELQTVIPTRSPNVWTSIATGKEPADHGVRHFVAFRLPGMSHLVELFPAHTGLNFHVIPKLEALPGIPPIQTPYTSNMRRAETLWTIAGKHYPVGVYRWLVTWPAEEVHGFVVAASVVARVFENDGGVLTDGGKPLGRGAFYPPTLGGELTFDAERWRLREEDLSAYVGPGRSIEPDHPRLAEIRKVLTDPTSEILTHLLATYQPTFTVAGFYPVDSFQHYFSRARGTERPFADAIAERYRYTDARLGELLATFERPTNVLVISDHGFDFELHHHSLAPPGIFIARGPAFEPGRRVDGLSIYDIAPLSLHLLGLPLADDMPGTTAGRYDRALSRDFLTGHAVERIATYETPRDALDDSLENPIDDEIREDLRSLGYIN